MTVVPLFNSSRSNCDNYEDTSLTPVASKLPRSVVFRRLYNTREEHTRTEQARLRSGSGGVDQLFNSRQLTDHRFTFHVSTIIVSHSHSLRNRL